MYTQNLRIQKPFRSSVLRPSFSSSSASTTRPPTVGNTKAFKMNSLLADGTWQHCHFAVWPSSESNLRRYWKYTLGESLDTGVGYLRLLTAVGYTGTVRGEEQIIVIDLPTRQSWNRYERKYNT
jgi:hypothetical protein